MRRFVLTALFVLGIGLSTMPVQSAEETKVDAESIAKLVKQLGSDDFTTREEAAKSLAKIGVPALEQLKKAAAESKDEEVKSKASQLATRIQAMADSERLLKPTRVHLTFKDTPVSEALKDFSAKSGFKLVYNDDPAKLADRKITLDTGDVTFWEAFDLFCEKSGLTFGVMKENGGQGGGGGGVAPAPPIQVFPVPAPPAAKPVKPVRGDKAPDGAQEMADQDERDKAKEEQKKAAEQKERVKAAAAAARVQIIVGGVGMPMAGTPQGLSANRTIILGDGKHAKPPTCYSGAARIQIKTSDVRRDPSGEMALPFEFKLEPRMELNRVTKITLSKVVDEKGQNVAQIGDQSSDEDMVIRGGIGGIIMPFPGGDVGHPTAKIKVTKGVKSLKEIKGTADAVVFPDPSALFTVENILKAEGKSVEGTAGGSLKIIEVRKDKDGKVHIRAQLEVPSTVRLLDGNQGGVVGGMMPGRGAILPQIQAVPVAPPVEDKNAPNAQDVDEAPPAPAVPVNPVRGKRRPPVGAQVYPNCFNLFDGKDVEFKNATNQLPQAIANKNGNVVWDYRLTFEPKKDLGEAAKLTVMGSKPATIQIPFEFKDVNLQ